MMDRVIPSDAKTMFPNTSPPPVGKEVEVWSNFDWGVRRGRVVYNGFNHFIGSAVWQPRSGDDGCTRWRHVIETPGAPTQ